MEPSILEDVPDPKFNLGDSVRFDKGPAHRLGFIEVAFWDEHQKVWCYWFDSAATLAQCWPESFFQHWPPAKT